MKPRPELLAALIQQESGGNPNAVSPKGARGLAQVMPQTGRDPGYGVKPLLDNSPSEQKRFANDYLGAMLKKYNGDEKLALAAYNAGPGNVDKYKGIPPFKETRNYVDKILHAINPISSANASVNEANDIMPQQKLTEVTDPELLRQLEGDNAQQVITQPNLTEVTDPELLAQLEGNEPEQQQEQSSYLDEVKGGIASAPINAYLGIKQMLPGGLDDIEKNVLSQNKEAAQKAPIASLVSNIGMAAPTALIPGANTLTGAGVIGAAQGLINPAESSEERLLNTAVGGVAGAAGQKLVNSVGGKLSGMLANSQAKADAFNKAIAPKKALLEQAQEAGYVLPQSAVNPTFVGNILEGAAGKDAMTQATALKNQPITNALVGAEIGADEPLLPSVIKAARETNYKPYQNVANMPSTANGYTGLGNNAMQTANQDLQALKLARADAQGWHRAAEKSGRPDDLANAHKFDAQADALDARLTQRASSLGNPELMDALNNARREIAKTFDVEKAANVSTGDVSAPILGRMHDANPNKMTGNLKLIGDMANTFRPYVREAEYIRTPGVSKVQAGLSIGLGTAGGPVAAALPYLSTPIRSLLLSKPYQKLMVKYKDASPSTTLKALTALIDNEKIKGMTPALSSDLATYLLNNNE